MIEENSIPIDPTKINLRNKGLRTSTGKLHKGCVKDAYTKLSIGSIPSNYESIIYHHEQKKGFGSSQTRFYLSQDKTQVTRIDQRPHQQQPAVTSVVPSHSKKGYGPLIAKEKRQWIHMPHSPGPGKYMAQSPKADTQTAIPKKIRKCFSRQHIRPHTNKQNIVESPGPGFYEPQPVLNKNTGCKSSFVSPGNPKSNVRCGYVPTSLTPGPGRYQKDDLYQPPEKQCCQRQQNELYFKILPQKRVKDYRYMLGSPQKHQNPGPGAYDSNSPNFKPIYQQIKISSSFVPQNKDRLDALTQNKVGPTPNTYEIRSGFDSDKKLIEMAAFMSECKRDLFEGKRLGPSLRAYADPSSKKNFHFNIREQWL